MLSETAAINFDHLESAISVFIKPFDFVNKVQDGQVPGASTTDELRMKALSAVLFHMCHIHQGDTPSELCTRKKPREATEHEVPTLGMLLTMLEHFFLSDDGYVRKHAMILLGTVIHECTTLEISISMVERLVHFCCNRLMDWYFVEGAALVYLGLLKFHLVQVASATIETTQLSSGACMIQDEEDGKHEGEEDIIKNHTVAETCIERKPCARVILDSILRDIHAPSFSQPIRHNILKAISIILEEFPDYVRSIGKKVVTRIFCQMENEKDPRNLLINFPLTEYLLKNYADLLLEKSECKAAENVRSKTDEISEETTQRLDMIADILLSYYPIRFKPVHSDMYNLTEADLQVCLSRCFLANSALATRLLDGCLDLLNDSLTLQKSDDVRDSVEMINTCVEHFNLPYLAEHYGKFFFDVIKSSAWVAFCPDLPLLSTSFAHLLRLALERNEAADLINSTLQVCVHLLLSSHSENTGPFELICARQLLLDSAKASKQLLNLVCNLLFSHSEGQLFKDHIHLILKLMEKLPLVQSQLNTVSLSKFDDTETISLQLYQRWIADLEFYRELTIAVLTHFDEECLDLDDLSCIIINVYHDILDIIQTDSDTFFEVIHPQYQEAALQFFELFMNSTVLLSLLMKQSDVSQSVESEILNSINNITYLLGFNIDPDHVEPWAIRLRDQLVKKTEKQARCAVVESFKVGLLRCCRHCPETALSCLQSPILSVFQHDEDIDDEHLFLMLLSLQVVKVCCAQDILSSSQVTLDFGALLLDALFRFLSKAFRDPLDQSPSVNPIYFQLIQATLDTLHSYLEKANLLENRAYLILDVVTELLCANTSRCQTLNDFISRLFLVMSFHQHSRDMSRMFQKVLYSLKNVLLLVVSQVKVDTHLVQACVDFLHLTDLNIQVDDGEGFNVVILFVLPCVTCLLLKYLQCSPNLDQDLQQQERQSSVENALHSVLQHTCKKACDGGETQTVFKNKEYVSSLTQEFVLSSYRNILVMFVLYGSKHFTDEVTEKVIHQPSPHPRDPSHLPTTVLTRGQIYYASIQRFLQQHDAEGASLACNTFLNEIVEQCCTSANQKLYYGFLPSLVVQVCFLMDRTSLPFSPVHCAIYERNSSRWNCDPFQSNWKAIAPFTSSTVSSFLKECFFAPQDPHQQKAVTSTEMNGTFLSIIHHWHQTSHLHERLALSSLLFLFLTTLPLEKCIASCRQLDDGASTFMSILLWTLESFPWIEDKNVGDSPSNLFAYLQFQAEIDQLSGYVIYFILSLLKYECNASFCQSELFFHTTNKSTDTCMESQSVIRYCFKQLLDHLDILLKASLYQAVKNCIPRVRLAALHCLYLLTKTKLRCPDLIKYKKTIINSLEPARNDLRHLVRQSAGVCVNLWSSL